MNSKNIIARNVSSTAFTYILNVVITFVSRTFFIRLLGQEYTGLNGLLTSILTMLSLADLGIDQALIFTLIKPLNDRNEKLINKLILLYRRIYFSIAVVVAVIGIGLLPFLPAIVGKSISHFSNIYIIFILFLANSVSSYLLAYNRTLINAAQKRYLIAYNDFIFSLVKNVVQIVFLLLTHSFIIYLIITLVTTVLGNLNLHRIVLTKFPYLKNNVEYKISYDTKHELKKLSFGNLSDKIGGLIVFNSDNILMSIFVGINSVGIYSNYVLLATIISSFTLTILSSMSATVGANFFKDDIKDSIEMFNTVNFANFVITYFTNILLIVLVNPFIEIWIGKDYLFSNITLFVFFINMVLTQMRNAPIMYNSALGISWQTRWKSIIEAIVNLFFSILLVKVFNFGVAGILLGTILSTILVVYWYEPLMIFKYRFKVSSKKFLVLYFIRTVEIIFLGTLFYWLVDIKINIHGFFQIILSAICLFVFLTLILMILHYKEKEFNVLVYKIRNNNKLKFKED